MVVVVEVRCPMCVRGAGFPRVGPEFMLHVCALCVGAPDASRMSGGAGNVVTYDPESCGDADE